MSTVSSSRIASFFRPARRLGNLRRIFTNPANRGNAVTIAVFGILGIVALCGVIFAGAFHQLFSAGICYAMCRAAAAESAGSGNSQNR